VILFLISFKLAMPFDFQLKTLFNSVSEPKKDKVRRV
jgi:hypothetical protein